MRKRDRTAIGLVVISAILLITVWVASSNAQTVPSQEAINATFTEWRVAADRRLSHLETIGDAEFLAILGLLCSQVINIRSQKKRRQEVLIEKRLRDRTLQNTGHVTED